MKKVIKLAIKTVLAPLMVGYIVVFWDWLYDCEEDFSQSVVNDIKKGCKKWFTTI